MNEDLIAELRAIKVPTKEEVLARPKLCLIPPHDDDERTQDEWIEYWNDRGVIMASMPDYYKAFRVAKRMLDEGTLKNHPEWRETVYWAKNFLNRGVLLSSTRIIPGEIVHHYNCREKLLEEKYSLGEVGEFYGEKIEDLPRGGVLGQLVFKIFQEDSASKIADAFEVVNFFPKKTPRIWTKSLQGTAYHSVGVSTTVQNLNICTHLGFSCKGISLGVRYDG